MGYYDAAFLDRLKVIRALREEHFLPLRVIRELLVERGERPLRPDEAALLARVGPAALRRLEPTGGPETLGRRALLRRYAMRSADLDLLERMGLVGDATRSARYGRGDLALLDALRRAVESGLTREIFGVETLGHYVELLGELARREVRHFTRQAASAHPTGCEGGKLPEADLERLAARAVEVTEPLIALIRRKLITRAVRAELRETRKKEAR